MNKLLEIANKKGITLVAEGILIGPYNDCSAYFGHDSNHNFTIVRDAGVFTYMTIKVYSKQDVLNFITEHSSLFTKLRFV